MSFLLHHVQSMMDIPPSTFALICVICSIGIYFVRGSVNIPGLVIVLYPVVVGLSAAANYIMTLLEMFDYRKYDQWIVSTVASATIGMIVGILIAVAIGRLLSYWEVNRVAPSL